MCTSSKTWRGSSAPKRRLCTLTPRRPPRAPFRPSPTARTCWWSTMAATARSSPVSTSRVAACSSSSTTTWTTSSACSSRWKRRTSASSASRSVVSSWLRASTATLATWPRSTRCSSSRTSTSGVCSSTSRTRSASSAPPVAACTSTLASRSARSTSSCLRLAPLSGASGAFASGRARLLSTSASAARAIAFLPRRRRSCRQLPRPPSRSWKRRPSLR
mmetsp:Transcript_23846/g.67689  ORF Transcript_23846/g.67689 Transcript_23846/m.67689 type:complete len:218 (+) Transcript_23846:582-1235(+)